MAFDEYCLEHLPSDGNYFFLWRNRPAVIIGLNQNAYSEVNLQYLDEKGIVLARRVTGGGAVYHDLQNMNYTFIGKDVTPEPFVDALVKLGVPAELTGRNDIFVEGRKVSGYARRVWRDREIVHGTMMYDVDLATLSRVLDVPGSKMEAKGIASVRSRVANLKDYLPQFSSLDEVQSELHRILAGNDTEYVLSPEQIAEVRKSAEERFASWDWVYGHSKEADMLKSAKLPCGTVEVRISLEGGRISEILFGGDFLGGLPASKLAEGMKGLKFDRQEVMAYLDSQDVPGYFDRTSAEDIGNLIF